MRIGHAGLEGEDGCGCVENVLERVCVCVLKMCACDRVCVSVWGCVRVCVRVLPVLDP